ncbi:hypothetical protein BGS_0777 [Beggiatoa sp. SS]|nr:hypothetical protein BGS_0777 [Beggiatoa sp. SS]
MKIIEMNRPSTDQSEARIEVKQPEPVPIPGIPITHPCQFFGQSAVLKKIRWAWQQPSALRHLAVIGERRSGKTSLLKYLQYITQTPQTDLRSEQPQGWKDWLPCDFQFVFIDFQLAVMSNPSVFQLSVVSPSSKANKRASQSNCNNAGQQPLCCNIQSVSASLNA